MPWNVPAFLCLSGAPSPLAIGSGPASRSAPMRKSTVDRRREIAVSLSRPAIAGARPPTGRAARASSSSSHDAQVLYH